MGASINTWLRELFRQHHRDLVRYASRLVGDHDAGEEVVQNTYLRLASRPALPDAVETPRAYVFAAARNAAFDFSARRNFERAHRVDFDEIDAHSTGDDPGEALHRRQRIVTMAALLNELPSACRAAFILNKVEGRRHREVAERLGISVSMVEKHIMRALIHLRDRMRD